MIEREGYDFIFDAGACATCGGRCCCGESGYIYLSKPEIDRIAAFLGLDAARFGAAYLVGTSEGYSLREYSSLWLGRCCVMFDQFTKRCRIYAVRPRQCREFPFWESYKENLQEVERECPGVSVKT